MTDQVGSRLANIPSTGLGEQVALALEEAILLGILKPGERIVEADTALRLGTSNGPVREALRELENLGLVVSVPRRGTFVSQFTAQVAREVFSVRALLEVAAVRLVLADLTHSKIARFELALDRMGSSLTETGRSPWLSADDDICFHDLLFEQSGHRILTQFWERLRARARVLLVVTGALGNVSAMPIPERVASLKAVHQPIIEALRQRNVEATERAIILHLAEGERMIVSRMPAHDDDARSLVLQLLAREARDLHPSLV
jgi:DNA-binding GntR family transcriptional regulator